MTFTTYCGCGSCKTVVADATGTTLPAAALADNYVFSCGELDYIELFVRAHVLGRTFRNASGWAYVVQPEKAVR